LFFCLLLLTLVPRFESQLKEIPQLGDLPAPTKLFLTVAVTLKYYWFLLFPVIGVIAIGYLIITFRYVTLGLWLGLAAVIGNVALFWFGWMATWLPYVILVDNVHPRI